MQQVGKTQRIHIFTSGNVHGVGFRYSTMEKASGLGLVGWVQNTPDGRVEIVAEGDKNSLDQLTVWCKQGPDFAKVESVETAWEKATGEFSSFEVR